MITMNNTLTRKFEQAWTIDFVYRLADLHWREWGSRLGIDILWLGFSPYRSPGRELIRQWASANGIPGSEAPLEMARRLGLKLYVKQRLLFSEKANYVRLGAVPFPLQLDILPSPLEPLGFRQEAFFPYTTPDGKSASGGVAYLRDDEGNTIRLPVTPWEDDFQTILWDWLSWGTPLPLFNIHELFAHRNDAVFILPTEQDVDWLLKNAAWLASRFPLTTWPGGLQETLRDADWGLLASRKVLIVVHPSSDGVRIADTLWGQLEKAGVQQVGFVLPEAQIKETGDWRKQIAMGHDIGRVILKDRASLRDTFLIFADREFGLKLDPEKEQALPLEEFLSLPVSEPIWLIPELLRVGDRVMVYGVAKSGKTTWIVHETLHMAAEGHRVLYIDGEMGVGDFQARLEAALTGTQIPAGFRVLSSRALGRSLQLETPEEQMFVLREAKDAEVVVFDNLHALFPSSLQAGPESCEVLNHVVDTLHLSGKTVIFVHHSSRGGASFGSSVKELGLELKLKVTRKDRDISITPEAARGLSPEQLVPRHFVIPTPGLCLEEGVSVKALPAAPVEEKEEDDINQAIRRELEANPSASCRAIAGKVGASKSAVSERMKKIKMAK